MIISLCWWPNTGVSICWGQLENFVNDSVSPPPAVLSMSWMVCEMGDKWTYSCCYFTPRICLKQLSASFSTSYLAFPPSTLLMSSHTIVLIRIQLERIPILWEIFDFHMADNLSIAVHIFPIRMLTSLSVDMYFDLVSLFNGISTFMGYLIPNPSLLK